MANKIAGRIKGVNRDETNVRGWDKENVIEN
jgi:hypothetical protein